jgi:hypothetical protein
MPAAWLLTRFDYALFVEMRPAIRAAHSPSVFARLAMNAETEAIAAAIEDGTLPIEVARPAFIVAACSVGEPLIFENGLHRLVTEISRRPGGADAGEILNSLFAGGDNMEPWLEPGSGLLGYLRPEEVERLYGEYLRAVPTTRRGLRAISRRRRGAVYSFARLLARLMDRSPTWHEMLLPLGNFIADAARQGFAIAVVEL